MHIRIHNTADTLQFTSCNTIIHVPPTEGVGIQNVKRRLELLYPHQHTLAIRRQEQQFIVQLSLQL